MPIKKLLVTRFTALGDVAMTIPVVESFCRTYPEVQVTLLTSGMGKKIYDAVTGHLSNLTVRGVNLKRDYDGIWGLNRLYNDLKGEHYDAVADLHDVLRTKWLRLRFHLSRVPVARIDKGRREKKALISHRCHGALKSGFSRYQEVFHALGFDRLVIDYDGRRIARQLQPMTLQTPAIGIAPFAQHRGKIYPTEQMRQVIGQLLEARPDLHLYLLGGPDEADQLSSWEQACPERVHNMAGRQTIAEDIRMMAQMSGVLSMDSSNMHLASLVGTPVVSVWGATHPDAGFLGYGQSADNVVQQPLSCRPCSIYGNKPCPMQSWECMESIRPETISRRLLSLLP